MNNSEGQTQESVGGMKWEDVQVLAKKHAEQIIEMGWRDNPDKDDIIADFISGYASAAPIKTEGEDENDIHANDTFFYLPTMASFICVGRDEGKVWYVQNGEMESKWFDKSDCQLIIAPSNHHLSNRKEAAPPSPVGIGGCDCVNVEFGSYDNQIEVVPPPHMVEYYTKQGGSKTICLDACVAVEVCKLWKLGITTTGCCCGHNKGEGFIGVIEEDISRMKEMGYRVAFNQSRPEDEDSFIPKSTKLIIWEIQKQ